MKVRDIMTSEELATATLDSTLQEIANMMRDGDVGAIPVLDEEDQLAGIITDRDIVVRAIAEGQDPAACTAEEILGEELHTIEPDADLEEAADLMARHKIRRLPVVEDGSIIGIISLGDISVKSEEDEAGKALEDISEGVKPASGQARGEQDRERSPQVQSQSRGSTESRSATGRRSSGEQVAAEETEYQRQSGAGRQQGGTRAESALAGRVGNQSKSQQSLADDLVNAEGEEEFETQSAGGGAVRQRANRQSNRAVQQKSPARAQRSGARQQGISNRAAAQEKKRQQKVTSVRPEATRPKKRAS